MINKKKGGFAKRYMASYASKDNGAPSRKGVMDWKKVDGDISFFSPVEGKNRINIIPYTINTKNHPLVKRGEFEVGDMDYMMDLYIHKNIGPSEASVICLKSTFGKPCPICEQSALLRKQGKEKEAGDLKPSRRVFYNIQDMKEPEKLKVFETSHYLFERELIDEARDDEEGGFIDFADPVDGKEIKFRASDVQKGSIKYKEFKSFSFEDRDEPISDELLDSAISFDEIMTIPTYEEVEKILFGQDNDDESDEPMKKPSKKFDDEDDEFEEKPSKKSAKVQEDEGDDEPDVPKKSTKRVESDSDDEPDVSAESEGSNEKSSCSKCKYGHCYGKDADKFDDCDECDIWDKCVKNS